MWNDHDILNAIQVQAEDELQLLLLDQPPRSSFDMAFAIVVVVVFSIAGVLLINYFRQDIFELTQRGITEALAQLDEVLSS